MTNDNSSTSYSSSHKAHKQLAGPQPNFLARYIPEPDPQSPSESIELSQNSSLGQSSFNSKGSAGLRKSKTKAYDRARHSLQAPISQTKICVIYLKSGKQKRSPWFYRRDHAQAALVAIQEKYGRKNDILLRD